MNVGWKEWEGEVVDGKFTLVRFLGGSERGGVFLVDKTAGDRMQTAVKLVPAASVDASDQLRRWKSAAELDHPNVIRVFESGQCRLGGTDFLYLLTEYAEEDLSQILPERALTEGEARQVLEAVLKGLAYIHSKGLVHARVKPSNILAAGDVVKISSDSLRTAAHAQRRQGERSAYDAPETEVGQYGAPADVWSLGVTLVEVLTQRLPAVDSTHDQGFGDGIPQPFREIVENSLRIDPGKRWSVARIAARLGSGAAEVPSVMAPSSAEDKKPSAKWPYALAIIVAVVVVVLLLARQKPPVSQPATSTSESDTATQAEESATETGPTAFEGEVTKRVMPEITSGALHSIRGKIKIQVKVNVDEAGNVTQAHLKSSGPSRYFARQSLAAAREWEFRPVRANGQAVASQWMVQFTLTRRGIRDSVVRIKP